MRALYDTIGVDYSSLRRPDPRIAKAIHSHLESAASVLNVGAGAGSYEPTHLKVTAVEPSAAMLRQRPESDAVIVQAVAEELPFGDKSFDGSMAILTVHHWSDVRKRLREMRRVTRGKIIILTFDPRASHFWLSDNLPELGTLDQQQMPRMVDFEAVLGRIQRIAVPIPHDCTDGMLCAYWRRPAIAACLRSAAVYVVRTLALLTLSARLRQAASPVTNANQNAARSRQRTPRTWHVARFAG